MLLPPSGAATGGLAGFANGALSTAIGSANGGFRINKSGLSVEETITVGGRTLTIRFDDGETDLFSFYAENLTLNIGDFIAIQGNIAFSGTGAKQTFAGEGLELFLGRGPPRLPNGDLNPLAQGVLLRDATVGLVKIGATYALMATGTVEVVGVSGVSISGTALVRVNTTGSAVDEVLAIGTGGREVLVKFRGVAETAASGFTQFEAKSAGLVIAGQTLSGDFAFAKGTLGTGDAVRVTANNVTLGFGDGTRNFVSITEGGGALLLTNSGAAGRLSVRVQIDVPGVAFDGTVALQINTTAVALNEPALTLDLPAGPYFRVAIGELTPAVLTIAGQELGGSFYLEQVKGTAGATVTRIAATGVTVKFGPSGSPFVNVTDGHGSIIVRASGVAASLAANVAIVVPNASLSGTFELSINTTSEGLSETFALGGETVALNLPAGPYVRVAATGVALALAGQSITGDFAFERVVKAAGGTLTRLVVNNAGLSLGGGIVTVSNASGALVLGDTSTGFAGTFAGSVTVNIPGVSISGALEVQINDTAVAVSESFVVGGAAVTLSLPAGPYLRVAGSGISAVLPGATLTGDFSIVRTTAVTPRLFVNVSNASVSLGGGLVRLDGASANFLVATTGIAGEFSGSVSVTIPNVRFNGAFKVELNTIGLAITETLTLSGSLPGVPASIPFNIPAGQFVRLRPAGPTVTIDILGQSFSGGFGIETDLALGGVRIALSGVSLKMGVPGATFLDVTAATGAFRIGGAGVAGSLSASASITIPGIDPLTANVRVEVNTSAFAVNESLAVGAGSISLDLPAGPFVRIAVNGLNAQVGGVLLTGDFYFDQSVQPDGAKTTRFALANAAIAVSGNGIINAEGSFLVKTGGIAGILSGDLSVAAGGATASGRAGFRINSFTTAVNETLTLNGRDLAIVFGVAEAGAVGAPFFGFFAENLAVNVGNFVTIEGSVSFVQSGGRSTFAGAGLLVFLGQGPARLPSGELNPTASGVLINNARVGLIRVGGGYALSATGLVQFLGINGVSIAGEATVIVNTTGTIIGETLSIPGDNNDPGITLAFPTVETVTNFSVLNGDLRFAGQSLNGNFAFSKVTAGAAGDIRIAASNVSLGLGSGTTDFLSVTNGSGALLLASTGVAGRFNGNVAVNIPNVSLTGKFAVAINSTSAPVNSNFSVGTEQVSIDVPAGPYRRVELTQIDATHPATLTIAGQTISGNYAFEQSLSTSGGGKFVRVVATDVSLDLTAGATPIATVRNGTGFYVVTTAGLAGRVNGTVTITPPAGVFTGDFSLAVNSTTVAVSETFAVGEKHVSLTLPAGPYVRVEALNAGLTFQGVHITGNFAFEQATSGAAKVVSVALTNGSVQLGGDLVRVTNIEGALLMNGTALAGRISASVTLQVPGVAFSGDVQLLLNTGATAVNTTFAVGARTVTLNVDAGPYVQFAGTNLVLTVAGQSLRGDFTFEQQTVGAAKIVRVAAANVVLSLGGPPAILTTTGGGNFLITPAGFAGELTVSVVASIPDVSFSGSFKLRINHTTAAVNQTFRIGAVPNTLTLPAGPFIRIEGTLVSLGVLGQSVTGNFVIEQTAAANGSKVVRVGLSAVTLGLGGTQSKQFRERDERFWLRGVEHGGPCGTLRRNGRRERAEHRLQRRIHGRDQQCTFRGERKYRTRRRDSNPRAVGGTIPACHRRESSAENRGPNPARLLLV